jgi:C4-dicarboxylate-specific signal transduction histidine kinase
MHIVSLPMIAIGSAYLGCQLLLDSLIYMRPFSDASISAWNPSTGLSFVFLLTYGRAAAPYFVLALAIAGIALPGSPTLSIGLAEAAIRCVVYGFAVYALLRPQVSFDRSLSSMRDLCLMLITAATAAAAVAGITMLLQILFGLSTSYDLSQTLLRYWVADMIGIAVIAPVGLFAIAQRQLVKVDLEGIAQMTGTFLLTMVVTVVYAKTDQLQLFYLLFLPVTWIAVRSGIEGVSAVLLLIQAGFYVGILVLADRTVDIFDFQARMLILAITGLVAGVLVTERRLAETQLRMNQHALAQLSRLGSMGELAAAIAHEINQPLSAAGTYTNVVAESLRDETLKDRSVADLAGKAAIQINRAADVVKRLRTLVRLGRSDLSPTSISLIIQEASDIARPDLDRRNIVLKIEVEPNLPLVMADRLQIEQVLLNLVRNSMEVIEDANLSEGHISIFAARKVKERVELGVHDTGPGFDAVVQSGLPSLRTKTDGLGIGLSLCRSIAKAHGSDLCIVSASTGATVTITLPVAEGAANV